MNKFLLTILLLILPCISMSAQKVKLDRGFDLKKPKAVVAPKGYWTAGGGLSLTSGSNNNFDFFVISGINSTSYSIGIRPEFCYFVANNMGVGCKLEYSRAMLNLESLGVKAGDIDVRITNCYSVEHNYSVSPFFRYYLPFGTSGRFSGYGDMRLTLGGSQGKQLDGHTGVVTGDYTTSFACSIGVDAGVLAFLTNRLAITAGVGLLSLNFNKINQIENQVDEHEANLSSFNFMLDILGLNFGIHFYL